MRLRVIVEAIIMVIFLTTMAVFLLLGRGAIAPISAQSVEEYMRRGDQNCKASRLKFNDAAIQYREAIKLDPNLPDAHFKLAEIYYEFVWNYEALHELEAVEKIDPNYPGLYSLMGKLHHRMGDTDKALTVLQRAIALQPGDSEAHYYLGTIYQQKNMEDAAIGEYVKATESRSDKEALLRSYLQLGRIYKGKKDDENAKEKLKKALSVDPKFIEAISELKDLYKQEAEGYKAKEKYDEAAQKYEEILKIDPDNPDNIEVYMELGSIYRNKRLYDKAIAVYTAVTKLDPLNLDAFGALKELRLLKSADSKGSG